MNFKNDRRKSTLLTSIFGIVVAAVLSTVIALSVASAAMRGHMEEGRIHKGVEELTASFVSREVYEAQLEDIRRSLTRIEKLLERGR